MCVIQNVPVLLFRIGITFICTNMLEESLDSSEEKKTKIYATVTNESESEENE